VVLLIVDRSPDSSSRSPDSRYSDSCSPDRFPDSLLVVVPLIVVSLIAGGSRSPSGSCDSRSFF